MVWGTVLQLSVNCHEKECSIDKRASGIVNMCEVPESGNMWNISL